MPLNPTNAPVYNGAVAPTYSSAGGYVPGQVEPSGGGWDPNGYNPTNPSYENQANSIGGHPSLIETYNRAPVYDNRGGYTPGQYERLEGESNGYDPSTDSSYSLNSTDARKDLVKGLAEGGTANNDPTVAFQSQASGANQAGYAPEDDWRVRISLADSASILYKDYSNSLLRPLVETNGVIFPYTPQISINHAAHYSTATPTHSNYPLHFFNHSEVSDIQITGDFTVQSIDEGKYLMAAVYFFRSATKMFFGQGQNAGNPPPIVFLDGYGSHYLPHVPCVISGFNHVLPNDVDYINIPITTTTLETTQIEPDNVNIGSVNDSLGTTPAPNFGSKKAQNNTRTFYKNTVSTTRVPAHSSITLTLKPVYSRKNLSERFDLDKFSKGLLLGDKSFGGYI